MRTEQPEPAEALRDAAASVSVAALDGRRPGRAQLNGLTELGRRAAERGVGIEKVLRDYLAAAQRVWREVPPVSPTGDAAAIHAAGATTLAVLEKAISALVAGHQAARQEIVRHEEVVRREFIDDLLRGDADVAGMVERAQPFGLDLTRPHHVALATPPGARNLERAAQSLERAVVDRFGDRDVLVAIKDRRIVVLVPGHADQIPRATESTLALSRFLEDALSGRWRIGAGRAFRGAFGVARSYEEARETLALVERLGLETASLDPGQLLLYRVLARDQAAIIDLVRTVLSPLADARGGAEPLLDTLRTYFATGDVATDTARLMHLSVRAITYRLSRVKELTGYDPAHPEQRFALHAAVLGARLLNWPERPLPGSA